MYWDWNNCVSSKFIYSSMDNQTYLYYSLNTSKKTTRHYKSGLKSISIIKVPDHISLQLMVNRTDPDGFVYPVSYKYVVQKSYTEDEYQFVYDLLFPRPNLKVAVCNIENKHEVFRNICIAIIKLHAKPRKFDHLTSKDNSKIYYLRYDLGPV